MASSKKTNKSKENNTAPPSFYVDVHIRTEADHTQLNIKSLILNKTTKEIVIGSVFGLSLVGLIFTNLFDLPQDKEPEQILDIAKAEPELFQTTNTLALNEPEPIFEAVNENWHIISPQELEREKAISLKGAGPIIKPKILAVNKLEGTIKATPLISKHINWPKIVIVIDDMGMNSGVTKQMVSLPGPITYSFLPYAENLKEQTFGATKGGHELLVHLPMEPKNQRKDPGPNALLTSLDNTAQKTRLNWNLNRFEGFKGVNNHMGSLFTENQAYMEPVIAELKKRGLFFLDSRTSPNSVGADIANAQNVLWADRDIFLDNVREDSAIKAQLSKLENIAIKRGIAIAIGHPYKVTYQALKEWLPTLEAKNIELVALSNVVHLGNKKSLSQAGGAR